MGTLDTILIIGAVGALAYAGYMVYTGAWGGQKYDPSRTDLFPFASELEGARKKASDTIADIIGSAKGANVKPPALHPN